MKGRDETRVEQAPDDKRAQAPDDKRALTPFQRALLEVARNHYPNHRFTIERKEGSK